MENTMFNYRQVDDLLAWVGAINSTKRKDDTYEELQKFVDNYRYLLSVRDLANTPDKELVNKLLANPLEEDINPKEGVPFSEYVADSYRKVVRYTVALIAKRLASRFPNLTQYLKTFPEAQYCLDFSYDQDKKMWVIEVNQHAWYYEQYNEQYLPMYQQGLENTLMHFKGLYNKEHFDSKSLESMLSTVPDIPNLGHGAFREIPREHYRDLELCVDELPGFVKSWYWQWVAKREYTHRWAENYIGLLEDVVEQVPIVQQSNRVLISNAKEELKHFSEITIDEFGLEIGLKKIYKPIKEARDLEVFFDNWNEVIK